MALLPFPPSRDPPPGAARGRGPRRVRPPKGALLDPNKDNSHK